MRMRSWIRAALAGADVEALADTFRILADPTRLRLVTALAEGGEMCVHELCAWVEMSQPAVSHQLRTLKDARLVRGRRAGREIFYSLDDEHVLVLLSEGIKHTEHRPRQAAKKAAR
jgi:ArsR family transcriptional regulator